jgi:hypothetical protein
MLSFIFPLRHSTSVSFRTRATKRLIANMYRTPQHRPIQRQSVPEGMTSGLTERVSIISSAKVAPNNDIAFKSPRLVCGYNWIESGDEDNQPTIAVPGMSPYLEIMVKLAKGRFT